VNVRFMLGDRRDTAKFLKKIIFKIDTYFTYFV
jgi:hypothetical protein